MTTNLTQTLEVNRKACWKQYELALLGQLPPDEAAKAVLDARIYCDLDESVVAKHQDLVRRALEARAAVDSSRDLETIQREQKEARETFSAAVDDAQKQIDAIHANVSRLRSAAQTVEAELQSVRDARQLDRQMDLELARLFQFGETEFTEVGLERMKLRLEQDEREFTAVIKKRDQTDAAIANAEQENIRLHEKLRTPPQALKAESEFSKTPIEQIYIAARKRIAELNEIIPKLREAKRLQDLPAELDVVNAMREDLQNLRKRINQGERHRKQNN